MICIIEFLCVILLFSYSAGVEYVWTERRLVPRYLHYRSLDSHSESYARSGGQHRICTCRDSESESEEFRYHRRERGGPGWAQYGDKRPPRPPRPPANSRPTPKPEDWGLD